MMQSLHEHGFVVLSEVFSPEKCDALATAYDSAIDRGSEPDLRVFRDCSSVRLANLVRYDSAFEELLALGPVLAACEGVIGEKFKPSGLRARTVIPGGAMQSLHVDVAVDSSDWPLVGFIIMVDEFRTDNGATRFVPGSHKWAQEWKHASTNDRPGHRREVAACGTKGSVIVFNGSTWHGHGANITQSARRSMQGAYVPESGSCAQDWSSLSPEIRAHLPISTNKILGVQ